MATIVLRQVKGLPLTVAEVDANFTNLNAQITDISNGAAPLDAPVFTGHPTLEGVTSTGATGTGKIVFDTSPVLVTPALGTPSSGTLTNCTFPTLNQNTTGTAGGLSSTLSVSSGGTGLTAAGTSGNVLTSNGTIWTSSAAPISLPTQTGNTGKYLITDGTTASWATVTSGVSLTGVESLSNKTLVGPVFQAYQEKIVTIGSIATSTYTIDTSLANIFDITLTASTTITFSNVAGVGFARPITLIVRQPASAAAKTLAVTNAKYTDGVAPVLSTAVNQIDVLTYWSPNGGTTFFGTFAMANVS